MRVTVVDYTSLTRCALTVRLSEDDAALLYTESGVRVSPTHPYVRLMSEAIVAGIMAGEAHHPYVTTLRNNPEDGTLYVEVAVGSENHEKFYELTFYAPIRGAKI